MKESQIEAHLVRRVKALGGEVRKVQWIGRRGAPDRLVMLPARPWVDMVFGHPRNKTKPPSSVWVELKAPSVKPERHQMREHARMRAMGQRVEVIDSIEAVERLLA
ncbi:hypothetical protein Q5W_15380 [Hydrogenophaga sp. PBC]|uniref:hypothetical protein n=1 Tax=Hydrogenophaga sp. PBC TaxID=795665 RepID=UPI0002606A5B|nr:hypothetical protein [Hydrogenophaga sp. PBC]AOS80251.1 hypothetical protein Q5W_15380 [Hydrogenophaga sp. PBC]